MPRADCTLHTDLRSNIRTLCCCVILLYHRFLFGRCLIATGTLLLTRIAVGLPVISYFLRSMDYPTVRRDSTLSYSLGDRKIDDPYLWLEDPEAEETKEFVTKQNQITNSYLEANGSSIRENYKNKLTKLWDFEKYGSPFRKGDNYFYYHNSGLQNQYVLYKQSSLSEKGVAFIDPNEIAADGSISLTSLSFSEDGAICAYGLSEKGSDWSTVYFRTVATGENLPDKLERVKYSCLEWTHDGAGVFYNTYSLDQGEATGKSTTKNENQLLRYHVLGSEQSADVLCAEEPDHPTWMVYAEVTDCGNYVVVTTHHGCEPSNQLHICDLRKTGGKITGRLECLSIVDNFESSYDYVANDGPLFAFKTNSGAPNNKIVTIDISSDSREFSDLIPTCDDPLDWVVCCDRDKLLLCYLHDVKSELFVHDLRTGGRLFAIPLDVGTVHGCSGDRKYSEVFFKFVSFLTPGRTFRVDFSESEVKPTLFRETAVDGFDSDLFRVTQVFYNSKDSTRIPMFIVHKKDILLDGSNPTKIYAYGGFNVSIKPHFSISIIPWMLNLGGVYAVANVRGGGEYGRDWRDAGSNLNKKNSFEDLEAAAEYLIDAGYTASDRLVLTGGSGGGLVVAATINRRPGLYKACVSHVGVMDMLRYNRFTIGPAWVSDYGDPASPEFYEYIRSYSPLHNVPSGDVDYPAMLLATSDHDDRVSPLHSYKLISELQYKLGATSGQKNPLLIRIETKAGHGFGKPTTKIIEELSDCDTFLGTTLGLKWIG